MAAEAPMHSEELMAAVQVSEAQDSVDAAVLQTASSAPVVDEKEDASMEREEPMPASQGLEVQGSGESTTAAVPPAAAPDGKEDFPMQEEEPVPATQTPEVEASAEATTPPTMPLAAAQDGKEELAAPTAVFVKPEKPKNAVTAYWLYSNSMRDEVGRELREKGASPRLTDVAKVIGQRWKELTEAERKVYEDKAAVDKQRYETEMQVYAEVCNPPAGLRVKYKHLIPQRPPSAQALFNQDAKQREKALATLQADGKETGERQMWSKLGDMWKEARVEVKTAYEHEHTKLQLKFLELLKAWQASPERKEIESAEKAQREAQGAEELAKGVAEARQKQETLPIKRARPASQKAEETPPKRVRGTQQSTPPPASKRPAKGQEVGPTRVDAKVLKEASKLGLAAVLENLAARPEIVSSRKSSRAVLEALKASGGLVNPAKRALLGL